MEQKPILSIVIPCYNHGKYLRETIDSVKPLRDDGTAEIIIINDGSTDPQTIALFKKLESEGWNIQHQENKGLAQARNNGIELAIGKYILPLDSDNHIIPAFFRKAVQLFEKEPAIDIIYSDSLFFGEQNFHSVVGDFDPCHLISENYIDACAIFRKKVWSDLSGYDKTMPCQGHEDWDFWVRAFMAGKKFYYCQEIGFKYRVRSDSMLRTFSVKKLDENRTHIYTKFNKHLFESIHRNYNPASENYKAKYLDLLTSLNSKRIKNIIKLFVGRKFS